MTRTTRKTTSNHILRSPALLLSLLLIAEAAPLARGAELTFFSSHCDNLDVPALREHLKENCRADCESLVWLHLHESGQLSATPHVAARDLSALLERCDSWGESRFAPLTGAPLSRAAYACALAHAEALASGGQGWPFSRLRSIQHALTVAREAELPETERWYVEGRVAVALPPGQGRDLKKALVNLTLASRGNPSASGPRFYLALAHERNGNRSAAESGWDELRTRTDPRLRRRELAAGTGERAEWQSLDGTGSGIGIGFFSGTGGGVGAELALHDDRLFDTARAAALTLSGNTRGRYGARVSATDHATFPLAWLRAGAEIARTEEDYFSSGAKGGTSLAIEASRFSAELGAFHALLPPLSFVAGWRIESERLLALIPPSVPHVPEATSQGVFTEVAWDTRDSRRDPMVGMLVRLGGFFPSAGLGTIRSFERWSALVTQQIPITPRHQVSASGVLYHTGGDAPFASFPRLSGEVALPGLRWARLRDRELVGGAVEYRWRILEAHRLAVFAVGASSASTWESLWKTGGAVGGGGAWIVDFSRYRGRSARLEVARFAGETVVQVAAGLSL